MSVENPVLLHVEDDPNDSLLLQRACFKAQVQASVASVSDGEQAVAYLEGRNGFADRVKYPLPDVILLDLKMPRKGGLEVLEWMRERGCIGDSVVIVFTSSRHEEDVSRAYALGAKCYHLKPVSFEDLIRFVKSMTSYWFHLNARLPKS
jgi:CheY-like chemotaxis protein